MRGSSTGCRSASSSSATARRSSPTARSSISSATTASPTSPPRAAPTRSSPAAARTGRQRRRRAAACSRRARATATTVPVEARLHAVTWGGATALMLSLLPRAASRSTPPTSALAAELALAAGRAVDELEAILDTATDGVVVIDGDGRIGSMNRARRGAVRRRRRATFSGAPLHRAPRRGEPQAGARLSRRARRERRRERAQRRARGDRQGAAGRAHPAVHDHGPARRRRANSAPCSATSRTGRTSRRS